MRKTSVWKSGLAVVGVLVLSSVLTAGCGRSTTQEKSYNTQRVEGQRPATIAGESSGDTLHRPAPHTQDRDSLMGRNQNPNMIIGQSNVRNSQIDMNNMEMMAKSVPGVEGARITLNGANAYVTLDLVHNITAGQARTVEQDVIAALKQKIPRYDFHVTSNEGFHR
ncbi:sporulation protein [Brevibacillus reuszeri]|uniref:sporulation protein n=1 Tax=Brevibacillus reuszeri TaxID=54915 RepID=UPI000CCC3E65|nr:sporulation protein [Brevibacillus reuszeri]